MRLRRVRSLVGVLLLVGLVATAWMLLRIERPEPVELTPREADTAALPERPAEETGCIEPFTMDWPGGSFRRVEAARACKQVDGASLLEDVTITIERAGRDDLFVSARSGRLPPAGSQEAIALRGDVVARSSDGELRTEELFLDDVLGRVRTAEPVAFTFGGTSGEAGGMEHDWTTEETELREAPVVRLADDGAGGARVVVRGDLIRLFDEPSEGQPRRVEVRGSGRIDHAGGHVAAESLDVELAPESSEPELAADRSVADPASASQGDGARGAGGDEASDANGEDASDEDAATHATRGGVGSPDEDRVQRILAVGRGETFTTAERAGGTARRLIAERIDHLFDDDGELASVEGVGGSEVARMTGETSSGRVSETLTAETIRLTLDGRSPTALVGVGRRTLPAQLVSVGPAGERLLRGDRLEVSFTGGEPSGILASGGAFLEQPEPAAMRRLTAERLEVDLAAGPDGPTPERIAFAGAGADKARLEERSEADGVETLRTLVAGTGELFVTPSGEIDEGTLGGGVEISDPSGIAIGRDAAISPAEVTLTGQASVETDGRISHGDEVVRDRASGILRVRGNQHTIVREPGGSILRDGPAPTEGSEGPGGAVAGEEAGSSSSEPVYVSSSEAVFDAEARTVTYEGGRPTLRQGDDEIRADVLVLDDPRGLLIAEGEVATKLRLAPPGSGDSDPGSLFDPTRLVHGRSDAFRWNREENTVKYDGAVVLEQEESNLSADSVTIHLAGEGGEMREVHAVGAAFLESPSGEAEGEEVRYDAVSGVVRVVGGRRPARARDLEGGFQTGQVLEMTLGRRGIRVLSGPGRRARGSAPLEGGASSIDGQGS